MDRRELRYFLAVAEERHFGRAAQRLYIAQSGLSKAIQRVEEDLGVALFLRTHRHVELTDAGEALFARAKAVLGMFDKVDSVADAARAGTVGTLAVAVAPPARYHVALSILKRFTATCPNVRLVRREALAHVLVDDLVGGDLDVGFCFCPPRHAQLVYEQLNEVELRLLLSSSHRLAARGTIQLADLHGERVLVPTIADSDFFSHLMTVFSAAGVDPEYVHHTLAYDEDLQGVRRGDDVVLSARSFLGQSPPGISILRVEPRTTLPLVMIYRAEEPSRVLARFMQLARVTAVEQGWHS